MFNIQNQNISTKIPTKIELNNSKNYPVVEENENKKTNSNFVTIKDSFQSSLDMPNQKVEYVSWTQNAENLHLNNAKNSPDQHELFVAQE